MTDATQPAPLALTTRATARRDLNRVFTGRLTEPVQFVGVSAAFPSDWPAYNACWPITPEQQVTLLNAICADARRDEIARRDAEQLAAACGTAA